MVTSVRQMLETANAAVPKITPDQASAQKYSSTARGLASRRAAASPRQRIATE